MEFDDGLLEEFFKKKPKSKSQKMFYLVISSIISILVIWFIVSLFTDKKENEPTFYEEKVTRYLIDEKGYEEDEIKSIEERGELGSLPPRYVVVTFENETHIAYIYYAHHIVVQASYYFLDEEYKGFTEEDLKNIDPNGHIGSKADN
jgi:hypothetical protein